MSKSYYFGDKSRFNGLLPINNLEKLTFLNIFFIKSVDRIFYIKAWSSIMAFFLLFKNRPTIIQVADGMISESNCKKSINRRPHFLYQKIYADLLLIKQSKDSLPSYMHSKKIFSVIDYEIQTELSNSSTVVFIFGNDPFVSKNLEEIKDEIHKLAKSFPKKIKFHALCRNKNIKKILQNTFSSIKIKNNFDLNNYPANDLLFITTQSTVAHDLLLENKNIVSLGHYDCETMSKLFNTSNEIFYNGKKIKIEVKKAKNIKKTPFHLDTVVRKKCRTRISDLIRTINLRRLASDLKSLIY